MEKKNELEKLHVRFVGKRIGLLFKKTILWSSVIALLFGSTALAAFSTEQKQLTMKNTQDLMQHATEYQLLARTMQKCVKTSLSTFPGVSNNVWEDGPEDIFDPDGTDPTVTMGAWVENYVTGWGWDDVDGDTTCDQLVDSGSKAGYEFGILSAFSKMIGLSDMQVICNKNDPNAPGLLGAYWNGHLSSGKSCSDYFLNHEYAYTTDSGVNGEASFVGYIDGKEYRNGYEYLELLYNAWRDSKLSENPYIATWDEADMENFDSHRGYYTLLSDFSIACDGAQYEGPGSKRYKLVRVQENGGLKEEYWEFNSSVKKQLSITGTKERTCAELAEDINYYAPFYQYEIIDGYKKSCEAEAKPAWDFVKRKAEVILNPNPDSVTGSIGSGEETYSNYDIVTGDDGNPQNKMKEYTNADIEEAQKVIEQADTLAQDGYTEAIDDSGAMMCVVPEGYSINMAPPTVDPNTAQPGAATDSCQGAGGAGALGWIVCPIMEWMGGVATDAYNDFLKPQLQVAPELFANGQSGASYNAWSIFQGIANTVFSIILLIVIFSQLTGVGIDNYGIKRILPKLIIAAVATNLSYVICQLAVDLSNILGNSLQALFDGLAYGGNAMSFTVEGISQGSSIGPTILTGAVIAGVLVIGGSAIWSNPAILLTLLVGLIGVVVAILFVFILLAARQAAVLILVVISPLAFVCYALPNTKKLFDKWLKMMQGLLIVYPICGLLIGGGNFASKLLLASGQNVSFISAFVAMLVSIVPLFFVPTVLKNSMNALGGLGGKISGFGKARASGLQGGIRSAEGYKNAQKMGLERRTRLRAGLDRNGNLTSRRGPLALMDGEHRARRAARTTGVRGFMNRITGAQKRQAGYIASAKRNISSEEDAGAMLDTALSVSGINELAGAGSKNASLDYFENQYKAAAASGRLSEMNAVLSAAKNSGYLKDKDIAAMIRRNIDGMNGVSDKDKAAWMRDTASKYGNSFLATDFELKQFMQKGDIGGSAVLGDYGDYAAGGAIDIDDIKPEDVLKMSGDSLAGLAKAGIVDQSMAQRILSMNPNISADKKIMLGALANGNASKNSITSASQFKEDAKTLMHNHKATGLTTISGTSEDMVNAWASATPQSVNVVQNFQGGGSQLEPVDVKIQHQPSPQIQTVSTGFTTPAATITTLPVASSAPTGSVSASVVSAPTSTPASAPAPVHSSTSDSPLASSATSAPIPSIVAAPSPTVATQSQGNQDSFMPPVVIQGSSLRPSITTSAPQAASSEQVSSQRQTKPVSTDSVPPVSTSGPND